MGETERGIFERIAKKTNDQLLGVRNLDSNKNAPKFLPTHLPHAHHETVIYFPGLSSKENHSQLLFVFMTTV